MRIRKNAKLSPLLHTCSSSLLKNGSFPAETFQTHVCQLNQSPWDVIPFHSSNFNISSIQFQDQDTLKNGDSFGAIDESVVVVASMMEAEDVVDDNNNNKPAIENFDMMVLDDNNNQQHGGGGGGDKKVVGLKRSSNGGGNVGPGPRRGRGRPKKSAAGSSSSNNNEFYYYSGFGPLWAKRRSDKFEGEGEEDDSNKSVVTLGGTNNNDDKINVVNHDYNNNVGVEFGCSVDVNVVPCISDEEDYYDDYCDNENGKRRMRKPVKERSLKSLM
ncbi:uncharacterized protein LOC123883374 [Trifolium pratense]|uniref:uncharacterized protein LOC123883374 n=1 Tax=Trifolium pratense TaxID=57577 RepID=UPI001E6948AA|nr:uncharacterized protein LOC123883374 [Trifolium pratense]